MPDKLDKVDAKAKKNGEDIHLEKEILNTLSTTVQSTKTSLELNIEATESPLLKITDTESLLLNAINSRFDPLWRTWKFDSEHMNADYRTLKTSLAELKTSSDTYCSDIKSIKEKAGELKTQVSTFETALNEKKTRLDSILKQAEKDVTEFQASCKSALETFDTSSKAKLGVSYVIATGTLIFHLSHVDKG